MKHVIAEKKYKEMVEMAEQSGAHSAADLVHDYLLMLDIKIEEKSWFQRHLGG